MIGISVKKDIAIEEISLINQIREASKANNKEEITKLLEQIADLYISKASGEKQKQEQQKYLLSATKLNSAAIAILRRNKISLPTSSIPTLLQRLNQIQNEFLKNLQAMDPFQQVNESATIDIQKHWHKIESFREKLDVRLQQDEPEDSEKEVPECINQILISTTNFVKKLIGKIINECDVILGNKLKINYKDNYIFLGFGSMGRSEMTPYSDIEFGILIKSDDTKEQIKIRDYLENIVFLFQLKIISLCETHLTETELIQFGLLNEADLPPGKDAYSIDLRYQKVEESNPCAKGLSLDSAGITALIKRISSGVKLHELIGTLPELIEIIDNHAWHGEDARLISNLSTAITIIGNETLLDDYLEAVKKLIEDKKMDELKDQFIKNIDNFNTIFQNWLDKPSFLVKHHWYRFLDRFSDYFAFIYQVKGSSTLDKINAISTHLMDETTAATFMGLAKFILRLRVKIYSHYKAQNEHFMIVNKSFAEKQSQCTTFYYLTSDEYKRLLKCSSFIISLIRKLSSIKGNNNVILSSFTSKDLIDSWHVEGKYFKTRYNYKNALDCYQNVQGSYPFIISKLYILLEDYQECKKILDNITKGDKHDVSLKAIAFRLLGKMHLLNADNNKEAVESYRNALTLDTEESLFCSVINKFCLSISLSFSEPQEAAKLLGNVLANYCALTKEKEKYKAYKEFHLFNLVEIGAHGFVRNKKVKNTDCLVNYFNQILNLMCKKDSAWYTCIPELLLKCYNNLGVAYHLKFDDLNAIENCKNAVSILNQLCNGGNQFISSKYKIDKIIILINLGIIYHDYGYLDAAKLNYDDALKALNEFIEHPLLIAVHSKLKEFYEDNRNYYTANDHYKKALAITEKVYGFNSKQYSAVLNISPADYSKIDEKIIDDDCEFIKATKNVGSAFKNSPTHKKLSLSFGLALERLGQYQDAFLFFQQWTKNSDNLIKIRGYKEIGRLHSNRGDKREAVKWFKEALRLKPSLELNISADSKKDISSSKPLPQEMPPRIIAKSSLSFGNQGNQIGRKDNIRSTGSQYAPNSVVSSRSVQGRKIG